MEAHKTAGIALSQTKYSEHSLIVRIFTRELGLRSFLLPSGRKKKGGTGRFQPLTLLELVALEREGRDLQRLREVEIAVPYRSLPFEVRKATVGMFLAELLGRVLHEGGAQPELFDHSWAWFRWFDAAEGSYENFHLQYLILVIFILGFAPPTAEDFFEFSPQEPHPVLCEWLAQVDLSQPQHLKGLHSKGRNVLLNVLLDFLRGCTDQRLELRTLPVLRTVFQA
jgi:DNA repair protein RecO (recombination protein O)